MEKLEKRKRGAKVSEEWKRAWRKRETKKYTAKIPLLSILKQ